MNRRLFTFVVLTLAVGCGGENTNPEITALPAGIYTLETVDGNALPFTDVAKGAIWYGGEWVVLENRSFMALYTIGLGPGRGSFLEREEGSFERLDAQSVRIFYSDGKQTTASVSLPTFS